MIGNLEVSCASSFHKALRRCSVVQIKLFFNTEETLGIVISYQEVESLLLTFHKASFMLPAHTNLKPDSEDIGRIITKLPSKLQENPCVREKAPIMGQNLIANAMSNK